MIEALDVLGAPLKVKSSSSALAAFVGEQLIPPGYVVPPHRHAADAEMLLVVDGELTLLGEAGERRVGAGECATFAPGLLHGFRNDADEAARIVVVATPGVQLGEMFRLFDRAGREGGTALAPPQIVEIARQYGVEFGQD
jgi:quercetin dioxygenase-like cupin family protein